MASLALAMQATGCAPWRPHPRVAEEVRRGYAHLEAGDRERAEVAFEHALEMDPASPEALNGMGIALRLDGRTAAARVRWEAVLASGGDFPEARSNLGEALAAEGRDGEALAAFEEALRVDPDLPAPRLDRARLLVRRALAPRAEARRRTAAGPSPGVVGGPGASDAAELLRRARRDLLHVLEARGDLAEAHRDLGFVAWAQGDLELSAESYGRAARLSPRMAEAHHGRCAALALLGRCEEAAAACRRCLEADPANERCRRSLGAAPSCARAAAPDRAE